MKRAIALLLILGFTGPVWAETEHPYLGLGAGLNIPTSKGGKVAFGGEFLLGFDLQEGAAVQLEIEHFIASVAPSGSLYEMRALVELKKTFEGKGVTPYLLGGCGLDMVFLPASGLGGPGTDSHFDAVLGAGLQFNIADQLDLFLQAKGNFVFTLTGQVFDLPLETGILLHL